MLRFAIFLTIGAFLASSASADCQRWKQHCQAEIGKSKLCQWWEQSCQTELEKVALETALNLCFDQSNAADDVRVRLEAAGWAKAEDERTTFALLAAIGFAGRLNLEDIPYSLGNAGFMAASVLGNSALGRDQPGYSFGDMRLATIGLREGTPYCILSGPDTIMRKMGGGSHQSIGMNLDGHSLAVGYDRGHLLYSAQLNKEKLLARSDQFDGEEARAEFGNFVETILPSVIVQIVPIEVLDQ